jgi:hypothetical protein
VVGPGWGVGIWPVLVVVELSMLGCAQSMREIGRDDAAIALGEGELNNLTVAWQTPSMKFCSATLGALAGPETHAQARVHITHIL